MRATVIKNLFGLKGNDFFIDEPDNNEKLYQFIQDINSLHKGRGCNDEIVATRYTGNVTVWYLQSCKPEIRWENF